MGVGIVTLAVLGTFLTFPLAPKEVPLGDKGESLRSTRGGPGRGMGIVTLAVLGTFFTSPFKGEVGRGMG
jgi:hypothetical protein